MPLYQTKKEIIDAEQFKPGPHTYWPRGVGGHGSCCQILGPHVHNDGVATQVVEGDWIIKNKDNNGFSVEKPEVFARRYEPLEVK